MYSTIIIFASGIVFLAYGIAFTFFPNTMSVVVTGSEINGVSALIDSRATYGGMSVAVGLVILYLKSTNQIRQCLVVIVVVLVSMAATRMVGFFLDGRGNQLMYIYLAIEIIFSGLALFALKTTQRS